MAILFADDKDYITCEKCKATTFEEVPVFTYKKIKDRQGAALKKELCCIKLKCSICGELNYKVNDLKKHRVIE